MKYILRLTKRTSVLCQEMLHVSPIIGSCGSSEDRWFEPTPLESAHRSVLGQHTKPQIAPKGKAVNVRVYVCEWLLLPIRRWHLRCLLCHQRVNVCVKVTSIVKSGRLEMYYKFKSRRQTARKLPYNFKSKSVCH